MEYSRYIFVLCIGLWEAQLCAGEEIQRSAEDSVLQRAKALRDSVMAERLKFTPYRPVILMPSEHAMKYQIIRLARMTRSGYPNPYDRVEDIFWEINRYPEGAKMKMVSLVAAGGAAKVLLHTSRRLLARGGLGFIVPNLSGLQVSSTVPILATRMSLHVASFSERRLSANIKGKVTAFYIQAEDQTQQGAYLRVYRGTSIIGSFSATRWSDYRSMGLSHYSKWLQFTFIYQKNMSYPQADAAAIEFRLVLR